MCLGVAGKWLYNFIIISSKSWYDIWGNTSHNMLSIKIVKLVEEWEGRGVNFPNVNILSHYFNR